MLKPRWTLTTRGSCLERKNCVDSVASLRAPYSVGCVRGIYPDFLFPHKSLLICPTCPSSGPFPDVVLPITSYSLSMVFPCASKNATSKSNEQVIFGHLLDSRTSLQKEGTPNIILGFDFFNLNCLPKVVLKCCGCQILGIQIKLTLATLTFILRQTLL